MIEERKLPRLSSRLASVPPFYTHTHTLAHTVSSAPASVRNKPHAACLPARVRVCVCAQVHAQALHKSTADISGFLADDKFISWRQWNLGNGGIMLQDLGAESDLDIM